MNTDMLDSRGCSETAIALKYMANMLTEDGPGHCGKE